MKNLAYYCALIVAVLIAGITYAIISTVQAKPERVEPMCITPWLTKVECPE